MQFQNFRENFDPVPPNFLNQTNQNRRVVQGFSTTTLPPTCIKFPKTVPYKGNFTSLQYAPTAASSTAGVGFAPNCCPEHASASTFGI